MYGEMRNKMADREISVKRMASEMDWVHFAPISIDKCFEADAPRSVL